MENESNKLDVSFVDIWELRFQTEQDFIVPDFDPEKIRVVFNMDSGTNTENDHAMVDIVVSYVLYKEDGPHVLLNYHTRSEFKISGLERFLDDGILKLEVLYLLVDTALHMTRGMMAVRTQGTEYRKSLPPLIDPMVFINPFIAKIRQHQESQKEEKKKGQ